MRHSKQQKRKMSPQHADAEMKGVMGTEEVPVLAHWRYPITYVSEGRHTTNMDRGRTHILRAQTSIICILDF